MRSDARYKICLFLTTHDFPPGEHDVVHAKPTVVGGVDAFEQASLGFEAGDAVPLAVKHLQPGEY